MFNSSEKRDVKINARIDEATKAISNFLKENDNIEIIEKILGVINESKKITEK